MALPFAIKIPADGDFKKYEDTLLKRLITGNDVYNALVYYDNNHLEGTSGFTIKDVFSKAKQMLAPLKKYTYKELRGLEKTIKTFGQRAHLRFVWKVLDKPLKKLKSVIEYGYLKPNKEKHPEYDKLLTELFGTEFVTETENRRNLNHVRKMSEDYDKVAAEYKQARDQVLPPKPPKTREQNLAKLKAFAKRQQEMQAKFVAYEEAKKGKAKAETGRASMAAPKTETGKVVRRGRTTVKLAPVAATKKVPKKLIDSLAEIELTQEELDLLDSITKLLKKRK